MFVREDQTPSRQSVVGQNDEGGDDLTRLGGLNASEQHLTPVKMIDIVELGQTGAATPATGSNSNTGKFNSTEKKKPAKGKKKQKKRMIEEKLTLGAETEEEAKMWVFLIRWLIKN